MDLMAPQPGTMRNARADELRHRRRGQHQPGRTGGSSWSDSVPCRWPSSPTLSRWLELLGKPDGPLLAIINLDPNPADTLKKIATLPRQFPAVNFFLMSQTVDPNLLMEAMHLGIKEFIPLPMSEEKFSAALERVAQVHGMGKRARIIHVIPTIGGCGSTTVACNVAAALATMGKTVLIDLDLIRGGVASYFDIRCRVHHRRRDGRRRKARQAASGQRPDDPQEKRRGDPGAPGLARRHPARQPERAGPAC